MSEPHGNLRNPDLTQCHFDTHFFARPPQTSASRARRPHGAAKSKRGSPSSASCWPTYPARIAANRSRSVMSSSAANSGATLAGHASHASHAARCSRHRSAAICVLPTPNSFASALYPLSPDRYRCTTSSLNRSSYFRHEKPQGSDLCPTLGVQFILTGPFLFLRLDNVPRPVGERSKRDFDAERCMTASPTPPGSESKTPQENL